jgi:beta-glucosidase/6-phospho-beta-glucosidase/beta-galactosidase
MRIAITIIKQNDKDYPYKASVIENGVVWSDDFTKRPTLKDVIRIYEESKE